MAAEFGGPAQLDGAHHATLDASEMAVMKRADTPRHGGGRYPPPPVSPTWAGPDQPGGTTSMFSRSSGLVVRRIRPFETLV